MVNALIFLDEVNDPEQPADDRARARIGWRPEATRRRRRARRTRCATRAPRLIKEQVRRRGVVAPTGPAGSLIFMNLNALHGSTANLSPWPRRMITLTYNAMSNKSTSPSRRSRDIVYDDTDLPALEPLGIDSVRVGVTAG